MTDREMLLQLQQEFVLLKRLANSNPISTMEAGKKIRRTLSWAVRTECEATLKVLDLHLQAPAP